MSFEHYYEEIYTALQSAGEGGLTVGKIAKAIKHSKSMTWNALQEMVSRELIKRTENYDQTEYRQVRYHYFQLPLFPVDNLEGWECVWCERFNDASRETCSHCGELADDLPMVSEAFNPRKRAR